MLDNVTWYRQSALRFQREKLVNRLSGIPPFQLQPGLFVNLDIAVEVSSCWSARQWE